jgi:hypothetical protein
MSPSENGQNPLTDSLANSFKSLFESKIDSMFVYSFKSIQIAIVTIFLITFFACALLLGITIFGASLIYYASNSVQAVVYGGLGWGTILALGTIFFVRKVLNRDFWVKKLNLESAHSESRPPEKSV